MAQIGGRTAPRKTEMGQTAAAPRTGNSLDRFSLAIAGGAVVLIAVLLVLVLRQSNETAPMDESRPAGVVHNYYLAVMNDDPRKAYDYLSSEAKTKTPYEEFARRVSDDRDERDRRIRIDDERVDGETARVTVRLSYPSDSGFFPFSSREYTRDATVVLRLEDGVWKLVPKQPYAAGLW